MPKKFKKQCVHKQTEILDFYTYTEVKNYGVPDFYITRDGYRGSRYQPRTLKDLADRVLNNFNSELRQNVYKSFAIEKPRPTVSRKLF